MAEHSKIEWCDSTFNPWIGCTKVSPACDHCYAERQDARGIYGGLHWGPGVPRKRTSEANWRKPVQWSKTAHRFTECSDCGWRGEQSAAPFACAACGGSNLNVVRRRVFCASLADVLDNEVPIQWFVDALNLWRFCDNIDWLVLTKRIGNLIPRLREALVFAKATSRAVVAMIEDWLNGKPPANVWLGATICNQQEADRDIPKLLSVPASVRFLSIEPMLGAIDIQAAINRISWKIGGGDAPLHWIIAGGESGPQARPSHPEWFRSLRDQCKAAGVPFLFKQWGEWVPRSACYHTFEDGRSCSDIDPGATKWPCIRMTEAGHNGHDLAHSGEGDHAYMQRVGKAAAGRLLDGETHNGFPEGNR